MKNFFGTMAVALGLTALAGCGGADTEPSRATEPVVGCVLDYQPVSGPREIVSTSDLLVRGTIGEPREGIYPQRPDGSKGRVQTDIIPIEVDSMKLLGPAAERRSLRKFVNAPVIYVEISCAFAPPNRQEKLDSLAGREVLAYLVRSETAEPPGRLTYGPAGQPQPLFTEAGPEAFLMELASGQGVRDLMLDQRYPGAELDQFLPDQPRFPPRSR